MFIFLMRDSLDSQGVYDLSPNKGLIMVLSPFNISKYKQNGKIDGILRKIFVII